MFFTSARKKSAPVAPEVPSTTMPSASSMRLRGVTSSTTTPTPRRPLASRRTGKYENTTCSGGIRRPGAENGWSSNGFPVSSTRRSRPSTRSAKRGTISITRRPMCSATGTPFMLASGSFTRT
jgi:hypothetical protein